jgi:hypothetical protein
MPPEDWQVSVEGNVVSPGAVMSANWHAQFWLFRLQEAPYTEAKVGLLAHTPHHSPLMGCASASWQKEGEYPPPELLSQWHSAKYCWLVPEDSQQEAPGSTHDVL